MERDLQLAVLGTGEERYHLMLADFAKRYPKRVGLKLAFDNSLAHLIEAGSDIFLMPSYYEPCGLNQMISLKYGTIPVVRATGGLDDTIDEFDAKGGTGNGFKFKPYSSAELVATVDRALKVFAKPTKWKRLVQNAMKCDFSWSRSAEEYQELYRKLLH
jgi:starch synthase